MEKNGESIFTPGVFDDAFLHDFLQPADLQLAELPHDAQEDTGNNLAMTAVLSQSRAPPKVQKPARKAAKRKSSKRSERVRIQTTEKHISHHKQQRQFRPGRIFSPGNPPLASLQEQANSINSDRWSQGVGLDMDDMSDEGESPEELLSQGLIGIAEMHRLKNRAAQRR